MGSVVPSLFSSTDGLYRGQKGKVGCVLTRYTLMPMYPCVVWVVEGWLGQQEESSVMEMERLKKVSLLSLGSMLFSRVMAPVFSSTLKWSLVDASGQGGVDVLVVVRRKKNRTKIVCGGKRG